jgi:arsenate reductase-like glutaredoxin family protein
METINISAEYPTLFINHQNLQSQKAEANVRTKHHFINVVDVMLHRITPLQWIEIASKCNVTLGDLFDRTNVLYQEKVHHTSNFDDFDLARLLTENPAMVRTPFVIKGDELKFYESATDL